MRSASSISPRTATAGRRSSKRSARPSRRGEDGAAKFPIFHERRFARRNRKEVRGGGRLAGVAGVRDGGASRAEPAKARGGRGAAGVPRAARQGGPDAPLARPGEEEV